MKKTFFKALCFLCTIAICFSIFCACQQETKEPSQTTNSGLFTVKFNSNGGTPISSIDVSKDQKISEPEAPTRENHIFHCWEHSGDRWFFDVSKVTSDITLDAVWIPAHDIFKTEATDNPNEILISGFLTQKELNTLTIPKTINGKTVVGFTDNAFEKIHDSYAKKIIIPNTIKSIGKNAFAEISSVHIKFLGAVNSLDEKAFMNCKHLEKIALGEGIVAIPFRCFYGASELEEIDLPDGTITIEEDAFLGCTSLGSILLPTTIKTIEDGAFENTENLSAVIYKGSQEDFEKIAIATNNDDFLNATVYYYSETEPATKGPYWHYENNIPTLWD